MIGSNIKEFVSEDIPESIDTARILPSGTYFETDEKLNSCVEVECGTFPSFYNLAFNQPDSFYA